MAQTRPVEEGTTDQAVPVPSTDLDSPVLYLNRELTWLAFNRRVLPRPRTRATRCSSGSSSSPSRPRTSTSSS